eukprot:2686122-Amphidinium_carterae.1
MVKRTGDLLGLELDMGDHRTCLYTLSKAVLGVPPTEMSDTMMRKTAIATSGHGEADGWTHRKFLHGQLSSGDGGYSAVVDRRKDFNYWSWDDVTIPPRFITRSIPQTPTP